jgi:TRAP-type C4-dicarboxylate transport system substrate-binding protein
MRRRPSSTRAVAVAGLFAVALATSACSGSDVDKAGGTRTRRPVVLTLANHEQAPEDVQLWIDEVQRRSGGSLRIQVTNGWRDQQVDYDKGTIADVQAGKVQLAKVAARAYDTVGVTSFQPLLAPFLIDNNTLQRRVLESQLANQMLAGTSQLGLVGLAVLPTSLRKPLGLTRPLVTAKDYRGGRIGVREGEVAKATFTALGATPVGYVPGGPLGGLDGAELDLGVIRGNDDARQARGVTANVTFWPKPVTVVVNQKVFGSLTASQQAALRGAGSAVVSRQLDFLQGLSSEDRGSLCKRGFRFLYASKQDLAGLRRAVQPVYDQLERNPRTRSFLQEIQAMKRETPAAATPDSPRCSPSSSAAGPASQQATGLDGVYRTSFTKQQLATSPLLGDAAELNDGNWGEFTLTLDHGRFTLDQKNDVQSGSESGTYTVDGNAVVVQMTDEPYPFAFRWSVYRDVLTFKRDRSLGVAPTSWLVKPWRRAG